MTQTSAVVDGQVGAGIAAPSTSAGTGCVAANFDPPTIGPITGSSAYWGILAYTGTAARSIVSVDLFMRAKDIPHNVDVSIWSRSSSGNMWPATQLGSGTVFVDMTVGVYTTNISPTVNLPAATDFFIVFDNATPPGGVSGGLWLPVAASGTIGTHYVGYPTPFPTTWYGPFQSLRWAYRVNCVGVAPVEIDIKPGSNPNSINCTNDRGVIPVAILATDDFDATTVDHATVTFEGAGETHIDKKTGLPRRHEEDVDGDGDTDLVFHFRLGDTGLDCASTEGTLSGETFDGQAIEGTDAVRMIDVP